MRHALMYHGSLELNHPKLTPGATTFEGTDGSTRELPPWPESAYLRFGYMEKAGKKFCIVRVCDAHSDVVVQNPMVLEPGRHMSFGIHLSPEPTLLEDDGVVMTLLEDLINKNADQAAELLPIRDRFKVVHAK